MWPLNFSARLVLKELPKSRICLTPFFLAHPPDLRVLHSLSGLLKNVTTTLGLIWGLRKQIHGLYSIIRGIRVLRDKQKSKPLCGLVGAPRRNRTYLVGSSQHALCRSYREPKTYKKDWLQQFQHVLYTTSADRLPEAVQLLNIRK